MFVIRERLYAHSVYPFDIYNKAQVGSVEGRDYNFYSGDAWIDLFTVSLIKPSVTEARERSAVALTRNKLIRKAVKRTMALLKAAVCRDR